MSNRITTPVINYFDKAPSEKFHRLAWSCQLHHFLVPIKKNAPVNIFEETILKLIKEGVDKMLLRVDGYNVESKDILLNK